MYVSDLNGKEIIGTFYEKELQKDQTEFRVGKVIKRKGDKLNVNPNKAGLFDGSFLRVVFPTFSHPLPLPPPSYFKKNLCNINITLCNC